MGTRFIPTEESLAQDDYKAMVVEASGSDIVTSDSITGVKANWLKGSLVKGGYDIDRMPPPGAINFLEAASDVKRWRDVWAAGQSVGSSASLQTIAEVVEQLDQEYRGCL